LTEPYRQIYFHRNSVVNSDVDDLEAGAGVWFSESMGEEGPKASTVRIIQNVFPGGGTEDEST